MHVSGFFEANTAGFWILETNGDLPMLLSQFVDSS